MKSIRLLITAVLATGYFVYAVAFGIMAAGALHVYQAAQTAGIPLAPLMLGVNSTGTLVGAQILQRALELTFLKFPKLGLFSMGFKELDGSVESASLGQDVYSRIRGTSTVTNFATTASDFTMTDVPGKLRNFRQIYHKFTAAEINSTNLRIIDYTAEPMALALANEIVRAMTSMVSRSNFNTTVNSQGPTLTVASGWTYANTIVPMLTALDQRGVNQDRYFLASSSVNNALLTDAQIVNYLNAPWNQQAMQTGQLAEIVGGLKYDKFPALSPTDSNLIGFAGSRDALLYVARAPQSPDEVFAAAAARAPFNYSIITEPNSGFSVLAQQWIDTDMSVNTRLAWLDGYSVGNRNNLIRLVSGNVTGTSGTVVAAKVENPGYGYRDNTGAIAAPTLTVSGGAGSGCTATATVDAVGAITGVTITAAGTGYTGTPTVAIAPASSGTVTAPATISLTVAGLA